MVWWQSALLFVWALFKDWLWLFAVPFVQLGMLWIIIPILLNWLLAEFYQEKKGTSLGNAISNGGVLIWVGVDWARTTVNSLSDNPGYLPFSIKIFFCVLIFAYGLYIVIQGIKLKKRIHFLGRVRVTTYFTLMFTPLIYDAVELSWQFILAIFIFFPVFYYFVEMLDIIIPDPKVYSEDREGLEGGTSFGGDIDSGLGNPDIGLGPDFGSSGSGSSDLFGSGSDLSSNSLGRGPPGSPFSPPAATGKQSLGKFPGRR